MARAAHAEAVASVGGDAPSVHVDFGALRRVDGGHEDARRERFARQERRGFGQHVGVQFVHADVFQVDVGDERVEHLVFGLAHVALQLREHGDGGDGGHFLKHVRLPVASHVVGLAGHLGTQVRGDDGALLGVGHKAEYPCAIAVDGIIEHVSLPSHGRQHDVAGGFQILLVLQVVGRAVAAVSLAGDGPFQAVGQVIERIGHGAHLHGTVKPRLHLGRVAFELLGQVGIDGSVLFHRVPRRAAQAFAHQREAFEHVTRHVEREHGHQQDVHQVDHLLTRRDGSFLYSHSFLRVLVLI